MAAYTQNMRFSSTLGITVICGLLATASAAEAACINRFTHTDKGPQHTLTMLTGKMTFQDAQALATAIHDRKAAPLEWVDSKGKTIATQFGELKVIRPMPVACDANSSGVIMMATFATVQTPPNKIWIKFDPKLTVEFDEQSE